MEIHKPKPWHNVREFAKEYIIIVLGVATALGAEQTLEYFHWRDQVAQAREVIATELSNNLVSAISRVRTKDCAEHRLATLAVILDAAAKTGALPPLGDINLPPRNVFPTGVWDSVVASQTATHFPRQQLAALATSYKLLQRIEFTSSEEVEAWTGLYAMVGPGRHLDPASEADLRKALSLALTTTRIMSSLSLQLMNSVRDQHVVFEGEDLARIAAEEHRDQNYYYICRPIGPVPPNYGQTYLTSAQAAVTAAAANLPDFSKDTP